MSETIKWTLSVQVIGGPKISAAAAVTVEAYDKIEAVVPAGGNATIDVQPAAGAQFLLVTAGTYENLTYEVDGSGTSVTLDGLHVFIGAGAVALLGATQNQFKFTNGGAADNTVGILVGRDATP